LLLALAIWAALALFTQREVGVVGEVAIGAALGRPPAVLVSLEPELWADGATPPSAGDVAGPLIASQVRPIERIRLGSLDLPLAINSYTGGLADWPARLLSWLGVGRAGLLALNLVLGALLITLVHRFLRFHGDGLAATTAALILATDAGFLFYRKALGGTELLLQAAGLLCLWSLWSRRWSGGRLAFFGFGLGVGLGLLAKATFVLTLLALGLTALLLRGDRPAMRPPLPQRAWTAAVAGLALLLPLVVTWAHHALRVPAVPHVLSHDFPGVQIHRVAGLLGGGAAAARESWANLGYWAGNPMAFLGPAYGAQAPPTWTPWRVIGWALLFAGAALSWRQRHPSPQEALTRFLSLYLPIQVGLLLLVARDLHHLAQATPTLALLAGLSLERLAAVNTPARSLPRARNTLLFALPWLIAGAQSSDTADAALKSVPSPLFAESGQAALVELLRQQGVTRVVDCDYELYGMLEVRAPEIHAEHAWGAASQAGSRAVKDELLPALLRRAVGAHLLVVRPTASMSYNLAPGPARVAAAAASAGLVAREVGALEGDRAVLYAVSAR